MIDYKLKSLATKKIKTRSLQILTTKKILTIKKNLTIKSVYKEKKIPATNPVYKEHPATARTKTDHVDMLISKKVCALGRDRASVHSTMYNVYILQRI